ncbi:hypothetical protein K2173_006212 [Erythroxylum novogranatense]|uniref:Secreted protein n=1 Tax=Erythroxylum novogranatense TaxID=1862640 RepID=A0AAV8TC77_9ROSI|nr:hypothetical protein K2173_006212 [Erythroxylum novogranatense]
MPRKRKLLSSYLCLVLFIRTATFLAVWLSFSASSLPLQVLRQVNYPHCFIFVLQPNPSWDIICSASEKETISRFCQIFVHIRSPGPLYLFF